MPGDWSLSYRGRDVPFGESTGVHVREAPSMGTLNLETEDTSLPRADGIAFGADYAGGRTIGLSLGIVGRDEAAARVRLEALPLAWEDDELRRTPGALATLVSDRGRRAFGRPRRFAPVDQEPTAGYIVAEADFETVDGRWYGPEESTRVTLVPPLGGGLVAPLKSPVSTTASSDRSRSFTVGGTVPTWLQATVQGPITTPELEIVSLLRQRYDATVAYDEQLQVDARPWVRSILRNGAGVGGILTRDSTRLSRALIPPGSYELVLRGVSAPGTASATLTWRNAYTTP